MLKSWASDERFSYSSKRWNFENIVVEPAPTQRPHPPIWMAGGSPGGIAFIASKNYNLMLDQLATIDQVRTRVGAYLDGLEKIGKPRDATRCAIARSVTIVKTDAERKAALERRKDTFKRIGAIAVHGTPGGAQTPVSQADPDLASDDSALMGSPQEIVDRIGTLAEAGAGYILISMPSITPEAMQQFAEEILPHVKNIGPTFGPAATVPGQQAAA